MSTPARIDDWDQHWGALDTAAQRSPGQAFRRAVVQRLLARLGHPERLMDIGSGQGDLMKDLAVSYRSTDLLGLEYSRVGVEIAARRVPAATFVQRDLVDGSVPPAGLRGWATHAVCSEVLEHVDQPEVLLASARAYLAPGCRLIVTVPGGPMSAFDRHIGHRRHFTVATLRTLLSRSGLEVEDCFNIGFPVFNLYRLVVVSRGKQLATDVAADAGRESQLARIVMAVFRLLLRIPAPRGFGGWQVVAIAREPIES